MPKLEIRLKERFENDDVDVRIDGTIVARFRGATTDMSTGLAGFTEAEVAAGPRTVEAVVTGCPPATLRLDVTTQPFLYVRKEERTVRLSTSAIREVYY